MAIEDAAPLRVLLVGAGGLAAPALWGLIENWPEAQRLQLILIDDDVVELSNLNRQILFQPEDIGSPKAECLASRIQDFLKPQGNIEVYGKKLRLDLSNAHALLSSSSLVVDACDSTETKFLINDYCVSLGIPFCYGGAVSYRGLSFFYNPILSRSIGCLRCLFGDFGEDEYRNQSTSCQQSGILGAVAAQIGFLQAQLSQQYLLSAPQLRHEQGGELFRFKFPDLNFKSSALEPSLDCPLGCSLQDTKTLNLLGIRCPDTFLRTKLALERLECGQSLKVIFDSEDSLLNVTKSVEAEGHLSYGAAQKIAKGMWQKIFIRRQPHSFQGLR